MSVIRYTHTIKTLWEKYLRVAFSSSVTPTDYKYTSDETTSKLRIYREFPRRAFNTPLITITAASGDASLRYLGNEIVKTVSVQSAEKVIDNTITYTVLPGGVQKVYSVDKVTGAETVYTINTNVSFNELTGVFTWDKGVTEPEIYYCTYHTFDSTTTIKLVTLELKIKQADVATKLEFVPVDNGIVEVRSYVAGTEAPLYYTSDEVSVDALSRELQWHITEPDVYFVTYNTGQNRLIASGRFVQSPLNVNIIITVYARSQMDRERIFDLLVLYIRHIFKASISKYIVYSGEQISGERVAMYDNQPIYENSITIPCVTHYSHYIDNSVDALINSIPVQIDVETFNEDVSF